MYILLIKVISFMIGAIGIVGTYFFVRKKGKQAKDLENRKQEIKDDRKIKANQYGRSTKPIDDVDEQLRENFMRD